MTRLAATLVLAMIIAASTSVGVFAQRGGGGRGRGGGRVMIPQTAQPSPSINSPSFPISGMNSPSFPLRGPLGIGPAPPAPFDARPGTYTRLHRNLPSLGIPFGYGYAGPFYGASALVFVDTAFVGSVGDLQARGVVLSPGRHYLDLEAPGYDKKTIEITVSPGEPLRYRYEMTPTQRAAAIVLPPGPPQTMYAIPGCYGGNRPPVAANLPRGCDIANVRVIRPLPRAN